MQSLKKAALLGSMLLTLSGASSMASAATFAQAGAAFTASGTIATAVKLLAWTPVPCTMTLSGQVAADGSSATINSATFTGNALCGISGPLNLPWTLAPTNANTATLSGFTEKFPYESCLTPSVLTTQWSAADGTFSIVSPHTVNATCRVTTFTFKPSPALTINP
ncbi:MULTISPECIES: protein activator [unclassified Pseudomonas]|uniref:protein activator n=1 Tax=unclassified Pseudomonas TaxID=196821 RepID=UPI000B16E162|nr:MULTISPECIES: protein activator [unclassified Pseudomonas]